MQAEKINSCNFKLYKIVTCKETAYKALNRHRQWYVETIRVIIWEKLNYWMKSHLSVSCQCLTPTYVGHAFDLKCRCYIGNHSIFFHVTWKDGYLLTSKAAAETAEVVIRLQKTRKREYLKNSLFTPYGTLMIFSWNKKQLSI